MIDTLETVMKAYLAGYMQGTVIEQCAAWRKKIRKHYENWKGSGKPYPVSFLDPMNGENWAEISPDGLKGELPAHTVIHKDYRVVEICDLIIANMDTFGQDRPLLGTICELAWGWQMHKPIIMITTEDKYRLHPFLQYFSSWIVSSVDELLEKKIINQFYKSFNSARY